MWSNFPRCFFPFCAKKIKIKNPAPNKSIQVGFLNLGGGLEILGVKAVWLVE